MVKVKTVPKHLDVPVVRVANIIKKFKVNETMGRLHSSIGEKKESRKASKQTQAELQDQGLTVLSCNLCHFLNKRRTGCRQKNIKKQLEFAKMCCICVDSAYGKKHPLDR